MKSKIVHFVGDPCGYRLPLDWPNEWTEAKGPRWARAEVGRSGEFVWVDLSQAYQVRESDLG